jgi:branched-subunit amino acid ABC-type transport system permease component
MARLIMLGAYTTYVVQLIFKLPFLAPVYNAYVLVAIPCAFVVSGVVGILLERTGHSTSYMAVHLKHCLPRGGSA